jgi:predicted TIM-barrel fold metal-dependent hydrolase
MNYQVISADSHLEVVPERWTRRVPEKYRHRAPRTVKLANGGDGLLIENRPLQVPGLSLCGKPYEEYSPIGGVYEGSPGTGDPEKRLLEQDQDRIDAEVLFGGASGPHFWRGIKDDGAYKSVVRAWNNFLAEEYCAANPDRLIAMGVIPATVVDDAVQELEHCNRIGLKGIWLNSYPSGKSYPTPEDDRFWACAVDLGVPVTIHVNLGFGGAPGGPNFKYKRDISEGAKMGSADDVVRKLATDGLRGALNAVQMILGGVFDRFPKLRIFFAENEIGWIPHFLEQLDDKYRRDQHWMARLLDLGPLKRPPSEYVREHCYWGFTNNPFGIRVRHDVGVDRAMWSSDFPHGITDWPNSMRVIEEIFSGVPESEKDRMLCRNAVEFFHL